MGTNEIEGVWFHLEHDAYWPQGLPLDGEVYSQIVVAEGFEALFEVRLVSVLPLKMSLVGHVAGPPHAMGFPKEYTDELARKRQERLDRLRAADPKD